MQRIINYALVPPFFPVSPFKIESKIRVQFLLFCCLEPELASREESLIISQCYFGVVQEYSANGSEFLLGV